MIEELPYFEDSQALFEPWADKSWAVFLDSGFPNSSQGRYDILSAEPFKTLVTRGKLTEIKQGDDCILSEEDPFELVKQALGAPSVEEAGLPFSGGALGYFGYDLARRLEKLPIIADDDGKTPDMMIGIYDWALVVDHHARRSFLVTQNRDANTSARWPDLIACFSQIPDMELQAADFKVRGETSNRMGQSLYENAFKKIQSYILEGDCYQVNLAQCFEAETEGHAWFAYKTLRQINSAPFSAFLNYPPLQILSSSPERFLNVKDGKVETKPIKGTRPRGKNAVEDQARIDELKQSLKDRAENLMIVDLLRNDIGKSCQPGSVHVPKLFGIETYATVHHLVSTVCGLLKSGRHSVDLLRDCFPGGSITGAPKIRAMEIIEELEPCRRGVYCGSIGYIGYDGNMDTNIAIRTLVAHSGKIRFWAGGGIIADSDATQEYKECYDKASAMLSLLERFRAQSPPHPDPLPKGEIQGNDVDR